MVFDSTDKRFKTPKGAVKATEYVTFRVFPPDAAEAWLVITNDFKNITERLPMTAADDCFYIGFRAGEAGLFWYHFEFKSHSGGYYKIKRDGEKFSSKIKEDGYGWQLTAYNSSLKPLPGFADKAAYQIFPDRFYREKLRSPGFADRYVHKNWNEKPHWEPDKNGVVLNNDYFGGNLKGIEKKLTYLKTLGVGVIYLNPIFEAHSNHRYNTADYFKIDPMLGEEKDFTSLCRRAAAHDIKIILDGVFSHTGSDSVYFNKECRYNVLGAFQSTKSKYYPFYKFIDFPNHYKCWWGFNTLPEADKENKEYRNFISGVVEHWIKLGASGFRLDVADELPDEFIRMIKKAARRINEQAIIIGEVWEDASNKISYGVRKRYLLGEEMDGIMNYPLREGIIAFLRDGDAEFLKNRIDTLLENHPAPALHNHLNFLSNHDTPRILTELAGLRIESHEKSLQSIEFLSPPARETGEKLVVLAYALMIFFYGMACIYYGDELGTEGYYDPFNRSTFDWNHSSNIKAELQKMTKQKNAFTFPADNFEYLTDETDCFGYIRSDRNDRLLVAVNRGSVTRRIETKYSNLKYSCGAGEVKDGMITLPPLCYIVCTEKF